MTQRIIVCYTKWGDEFYAAEGDEQFRESALKILKGRVDDDFWYYDEDKDKATAIVLSGDGDAAWEFLHSRTDHEYEGIALDYMH